MSFAYQKVNYELECKFFFKNHNLILHSFFILFFHNRINNGRVVGAFSLVCTLQSIGKRFREPAPEGKGNGTSDSMLGFPILTI